MPNLGIRIKRDYLPTEKGSIPKLSVAFIYSLILLNHRCSEVMTVPSFMDLRGGEEFVAV